MKIQITFTRSYFFGDHAETKEIALDGEYYQQFQLESAVRMIIDDSFGNMDKLKLLEMKQSEIKIKIISLDEENQDDRT